MEKRCTKCGEIKDVGEFYKAKRTKDGLRPECKECSREVYKEYRENNPEKVRERSKKYRENNPEKEKKRLREWYKNNTEKVKESTKTWQKNNPEKVKESYKKWQKNNPEKVKEREAKKRLNLTDSCVANILHIPVATLRQLPPELIELKRNIIKLKRARNEKRND